MAQSARLRHAEQLGNGSELQRARRFNIRLPVAAAAAANQPMRAGHGAHTAAAVNPSSRNSWAPACCWRAAEIHAWVCRHVPLTAPASCPPSLCSCSRPRSASPSRRSWPRRPSRTARSPLGSGERRRAGPGRVQRVAHSGVAAVNACGMLQPLASLVSCLQPCALLPNPSPPCPGSAPTTPSGEHGSRHRLQKSSSTAAVSASIAWIRHLAAQPSSLT